MNTQKLSSDTVFICKVCGKQTLFSQRFHRWDIVACSMSCLDVLCEPRFTQEKISSEIRESKKAYHPSYKSGGGSAY